MPATKLFRFTPALLLFVGGCADLDDADSDIAFRAAETSVDMHAPTAEDPVVATLFPGAPFELGGRYHYVRGPLGQPDMSRFLPQNVDTIPSLLSGDTVRVVRGGKASLARMIGLTSENQVFFVGAEANAFAPNFQKIPWSAWGSHASDMYACAEEIETELEPCLEATEADATACNWGANQELSDCASGGGFEVDASVGQTGPLQFECLLPAGSSIQVMNMDINYTPPGFSGQGCDCSFSGTISYQPGDFGCDIIYDGSISDCQPPCDSDLIDIEGPIIATEGLG